MKMFTRVGTAVLLMIAFAGFGQAADLGSAVPCPCGDQCKCLPGQCPGCPAVAPLPRPMPPPAPTAPEELFASADVCVGGQCRQASQVASVSYPTTAVVQGSPEATEGYVEARRHPIRDAIHRIFHKPTGEVRTPVRTVLFGRLRGCR